MIVGSEGSLFTFLLYLHEEGELRCTDANMATHTL